MHSLRAGAAPSMMPDDVCLGLCCGAFFADRRACRSQVLRKPDAIALTEAFSRRGGAAPALRSGGQAGAGGAPAAPAAASAAASVGQVCSTHRRSKRLQ